MVNIPDFLQKDKSMIIAPAGYGKTHTIIECLTQNQEPKRILILTHTHAGVASIKEKIKANNILSSKFQIDTICSFAIQLAQNYHINKADFPNAESANEYFSFAITTAIKAPKGSPGPDTIIWPVSETMLPLAKAEPKAPIKPVTPDAKITSFGELRA